MAMGVAWGMGGKEGNQQAVQLGTGQLKLGFDRVIANIDLIEIKSLSVVGKEFKSLHLHHVLIHIAEIPKANSHPLRNRIFNRRSVTLNQCNRGIKSGISNKK